MRILYDFGRDNMRAFFVVDSSIFRFEGIEMLAVDGEGLPFVVNGREDLNRD